MSEARVIYPRNRLADMIDRSEGVSIADALARAHDNLESVREECGAAIDQMVGDLRAMVERLEPAPSDDSLRQMYELSNEIVGVAATLDLRDVSRAAYSLCELIDRHRTRGTWSQRSARVHIEALQLLREPGGNAAGRESILSGLEQVLYFVR